MHTQNTKQSWRVPFKRHFGDVKPSPAADQELSWFFNEAEMAIDQPSNFCAHLAGMSASIEDAERRAEAMHAAGKIRTWLLAVSPTEALLLAGIYAERLWPRAVKRALGSMAGPMEASAIVRVEHLQALVAGRTKTRKPAEWLEELVQAHDPRLETWRRDVKGLCAIAVRAYERVRGTRPSVVPQEDE